MVASSRREEAPLRGPLRPPVYRIPERKYPRFVMPLAVLVVAIVILFALTGYVSRATVFVTPQTENVTVDYSLRAEKGAGASDIRFEVVTHEVFGTESVPANGTEHVERKAKGTIVVYNAYSSAPQQLVASTRFEAKNGKIYRVQNDLTIPGMNGALPGSREVEVVADEPGASYNQPLTDFTIPGFKGSPRYEKFYGRSKTELTGGFSGEMPRASEEEVAAALKKLEAKLLAQVRREALTEIPEGFVTYEGATRVSFKDVSNSSGAATSSSEFIVRAEARLEAFIINREGLTTELAERAIKNYQGEGIRVVNLPDLDVVLSDAVVGSFEDTTDFVFRLRGPAVFALDYNEEDLRMRLAGQRSSSYQEVLKTFPTIIKADAQISPMWAFSFPADPGRIKVVEQLPPGTAQNKVPLEVEPPR